MILTVGGIKGGSGKSTLATHLAVMLSQHEYKVCLLDADEQATSYDFTQLRVDHLGAAGYTCTKASGRGVLRTARDLAEVYDAVVVDVAGSDSPAQRAALLASDTAIFPFVPRPYDAWTLDGAIALLDDVRSVNSNLNAFSYLSRSEARGPLVEASRELLAGCSARGLEFSGLRIGNRIAFAAAAGSGLAAHEYKPVDQQAAEEMQLLFGYTLAFYKRVEGRNIANARISDQEKAHDDQARAARGGGDSQG